MTTTCRQGCSRSEIFPVSRQFVSVSVCYRNLPHTCMTLVAISAMQSVDEDPARLLQLFSREELLHLQSLRFARRRYEWLAGRVAAKAAACLHAYGEQHSWPPEALTILADTHGRPDPDHLWPPALSRPTISHSHEYAAAMVAPVRCGIDLQRLEKRIVGLAGRIINADEEKVSALLLRQDQTLGLTLVWSVKEAVKKMLLSDRPGLFAAILIEEIEEIGPDQWQVCCRLVDTGRAQAVEAVLFERYILAWCTEEGDNA